MPNLVIIDDHPVAKSRVEDWLETHKNYDLELDEAASRRVKPDDWGSIRDHIMALSGANLFVLDLRLRFEKSTRGIIETAFGLFPSDLASELHDGFAVVNLILRNVALKDSVVVLNSTMGIGDDFLKHIRNLEGQLERKNQIRFLRSHTALSTSSDSANKVLNYAAQEFFGETEDESLSDIGGDKPIRPGQFELTLRSICNDHPLFETELVRKLSEPRAVTLAQLRQFATMYYPHVLRTRRYQAAALSICPDENVQQALASILHDEFGNGLAETSHPELYRDFLRGLNVPEDQWDREPQVDEMAQYIGKMERISSQDPWRMAVGAAGLGGELPIPRLYSGFLRGFGSLADLGSGAKEIFELHVEMDELHGDILLNALLRSVSTRGHQSDIEKGLRFSLNRRSDVMVALGSRIFGNAK